MVLKTRKDCSHPPGFHESLVLQNNPQPFAWNLFIHLSLSTYTELFIALQKLRAMEIQQQQESQLETAAPNNSPRNISNLSWAAIVIALFSALFLFALDQTIVADIQPQLLATFGEIALMPWVSVAYPLGAIALNLLVYVHIATQPIAPVTKIV